MGSIIDYIPTNSIVHRLNPMSKLVWTTTLMIIAMLLDQAYPLFMVFLSVIAVAICARVFLRLLPTIKGLAIFSMTLVLLQVLFTQQGDVLFYLLPGHYVPVTTGALLLGTAMALRMMSIVLSFLVFLSCTQYKDINLLLSETFRLPYDYVFMFMTALRFVPSFLVEMQQVRDAQASRACPVDGKNPFIKLSAYTQIAVPLVLISLQKAERLAIAMETRGYGNRQQRTSYKSQDLHMADSLVLFMIALFLLGTIWAKIQGFGGI